MKSLQIILLGVLCLMGSARADEVAPDALIKSTVQEIITIIKQDKEIQAGNKDKVTALVNTKVLPHFNFQRMTRDAMATNWRDASLEQKKALVSEFRNMLVRTYSAVFTVYRDQVIEVKPLMPKLKAEDTEAVVQMIIKKPGEATINVEYNMVKTAEGWKAVDVVIGEGDAMVSMVLNYRKTFAGEIERNGIDGLIKTMASKNASAASEPLVKAKAK